MLEPPRLEHDTFGKFPSGCSGQAGQISLGIGECKSANVLRLENKIMYLTKVGVSLQTPSLVSSNRERRQKTMTIALGYLCHGGAVVSADTAIVIPPSQLQEGSKLATLFGKSGNFAIVNSSDDGHATAALLAEILRDLERMSLKDYWELSALFKQRMTEWSDGFGQRNPPPMQLILGAKLFGVNAKLFFCEPPNTVREVDDYIAAGSGSAVTDPLYNTFFGNNGGDHTDIQIILRRVCYLTYRAKKDDVYCGKRTECAVVGNDTHGVIEVDRQDIDFAEQYSQDVDFLLSSAAVFSTESDDNSIDRNGVELADMLKSSHLRRVTFHDHAGRTIIL
jgi:hypothetical protein